MSTPESELRAIAARFGDKGQKLFRSVRAAVRKRLPAANEIAYDYGSSLVISYSPSDHGNEGVVSTSLRADGVRLYFTQGSKMRDPKKLLKGSAGVRYVELESARDLAHPDVEGFILAAIEMAKVPLPLKGKGTLTMRSTAAKRRASGQKK
jgi:hypothetical protein